MPAPDLASGTKDLATAALDRWWIANLTYVRTDEGLLHLAFILDACSHKKLVGWSMASHRLRTELVVDALGMTVWRRKPGARLILTTPIVAGRSTRLCHSAGGSKWSESRRRWAVAAPLCTMLWSKVSSRRSRRSWVIVTTSLPEKRPGWRSSSSMLRGSTTGRGGTRRWAT